MVLFDPEETIRYLRRIQLQTCIRYCRHIRLYFFRKSNERQRCATSASDPVAFTDRTYCLDLRTLLPRSKVDATPTVVLPPKVHLLSSKVLIASPSTSSEDVATSEEAEKALEVLPRSKKTSGG